MIRVQAKQVFISVFAPDQPRAEDYHKKKYQVTVMIDPESWIKLVDRVSELTPHLVDKWANTVDEIVAHMRGGKPSKHSGLYAIDCWGEDSSLVGLMLNGECYPYDEIEPERHLVLMDVVCYLTCRVMQRKDKTVSLIFTCPMIRSISAPTTADSHTTTDWDDQSDEIEKAGKKKK